MTVYECCQLVRETYSQIGSGDLGFAPKAIHCAVKALDEIAGDDSLPMMTRHKAAQAAANLLISDHDDE